MFKIHTEMTAKNQREKKNIKTTTQETEENEETERKKIQWVCKNVLR